jgi:HlyD family secretion protein
MKWKRIILWGLAAAALVGAAVMAFRPQPVPVDIAVVASGLLEVTVEGDGITRIRQTYEVSAPLTGFAVRSPVEVGDAVAAGETVVAAIYPAAPAFLDARAREQAEATVTEAEAALRVAEANIARSQSDLEYAQSQYDRNRALAERGVFPQRSLDDAILQLRTREAALAAAQSEREMLQATLERARATLIGPAPDGDLQAGETCCIDIHAPADGTVLSVVNTSARLVQAGEPLLTVGSPGDLEIEVELLSTDAVRIAIGAHAHVERWGGPSALDAVVRRIEPSAFTKVSALGIEEQRVRVILDFTGPPEERAALGHGYRVFVRVVEWRGEDVPQVPVSALFRSGDGWAVFRVRDDRAEAVPVAIGRRNNLAAELIDGLAPGDRVVVHPSDRVEHGVRIFDRAAL